MPSALWTLKFLALGWAVSAAACLHTTPTGFTGDLTAKGVVQSLRQQGVTVSIRGTEPRDSFPFFPVPATRLVVNGDDVHVFEFETQALADSAASTVAAAGTPIGTTQVTWLAPPRFYHGHRFIVLYLADTPEVVRALGAVFDKPFAGRIEDR